MRKLMYRVIVPLTPKLLCITAFCRMRKLMYRVVFPLELKLSNVLPDSQGADALYTLFAVVVHVGSGPHHGA